MAMCAHCQRPFRNRQAVRAHLAFCPVWNEKKGPLAKTIAEARRRRIGKKRIQLWRCTNKSCARIYGERRPYCECGNNEWEEAGEI